MRKTRSPGVLAAVSVALAAAASSLVVVAGGPAVMATPPNVIPTASCGSAPSQSCSSTPTPTASAGGDVELPTAPAGLVATDVTPFSVRLSWQPSTDNVGVDRYVILMAIGHQPTLPHATTSDTSFLATDLLPGVRYAFNIQAFDAAGNGSSWSTGIFVVTQTNPTACEARYEVQGQWPGGFVARMTFTNTGTTDVDHWSAWFRFQGDEAITHAWEATVQQSGPSITVRDVGYNAEVPPGASVSFGFTATVSGSPTPPPTGLYLNGAACTV